MSEPLPLEASCRLISPLFAGLESRGISPEELLDGLAVPVSDLRDPSRWIDWATLHEVARRVEEVLPLDQAYEMGITSFDAPMFQHVGAAIRTLLTLKRAYLWSLAPSGVFHRYYTCFQTEVHELGPDRLEITMRMKPGYPVSRFFQASVHGQLVSMPKILGLPHATVVATDLPDGTHFDVSLPAYQDGRSRLRRLLSFPSALVSAADQLRDVHSEMEEKLRELQAEVRRREAVEAELRAEILERRRAEAERASLEDELLQARRLESIGLLAGGVAHDFNNLLVVILGHAHVAQNLSDHPRVSRSLAEITEAGERAADLTRQLLAFGRRQVLQPEALDVAEVVEGVSPLLRRLLREHVELAVHAPRGLGFVEADATQLEQVLMNLAVNGRDAMPDGGELTIELEVAELDDEYAATHAWSRAGRFILLRVTDSGVGVAPESMEQMFDPFFSTKPEGTGLGLSVVFGIVSQHGGFLHVYSEVGVGTSMKVYLPTSAKEPRPDASPQGATVRGGNESILLVEDEVQVRSLTRRVLEDAGYHVTVATSGDAAIAIFESRADAFDLLLLDVVLPGASGRAVHDAARAIRGNIRVLFTSGYSPRGVHSEFILNEGLDFLAKPYSPTGLLRRVRAALD